jgi:hypothetical protein
MAQLYSNENFPRQVVEELRRLGHDVLTIQETGKAGQRIPQANRIHVALNAQAILAGRFIRVNRPPMNYSSKT